MKIPATQSSFHQDPQTNPPLEFKNETTIIKSSNDQAKYNTFLHSFYPLTVVKFCGMRCFKQSPKYSEECLNTCTSKYQQVFDLFQQNVDWYEKKVSDMKMRGEVPQVLLDQVDSDNKF